MTAEDKIKRIADDCLASLDKWLAPRPKPEWEALRDVRDAIVVAAEVGEYRTSAEIAFRHGILGQICIRCGKGTDQLSLHTGLDRKYRVSKPHVTAQVHDEVLYEADSDLISVFCHTCAATVDGRFTFAATRYFPPTRHVP